jgi:two-component system, cell cycle sensor histidine kinase and response regulator CckA
METTPEGDCQHIRELRASEENLRLLTENIREVFWVLDADTSEVRYVSPAYETVWGRTCQSLRQAPRSWLDAVHPEDRGRVEENLPRQREMPTETTYRIARPDRSERWIRDRSFPVRDERGRVRKVVGLAEDVTALVKTEERLRQAAKLDALGQLAGGVAHDFNNLLSIILSYLDLTLASPGLTAQQREDLELVRSTSESAATLTRQLLTFSRQQVIESRVIDLPRAVAGMERMLRRVVRDGRRRSRGRRRRAGRLRTPARGRQRDGDDRGDARAHLRALLHHQGARQGNGAGARDGLRDRGEVRRRRRGGPGRS